MEEIIPKSENKHADRIATLTFLIVLGGLFIIINLIVLIVRSFFVITFSKEKKEKMKEYHDNNSVFNEFHYISRVKQDKLKFLFG